MVKIDFKKIQFPGIIHCQFNELINQSIIKQSTYQSITKNKLIGQQQNLFRAFINIFYWISQIKRCFTKKQTKKQKSDIASWNHLWTFTYGLTNHTLANKAQGGEKYNMKFEQILSKRTSLKLDLFKDAHTTELRQTIVEGEVF